MACGDLDANNVSLLTVAPKSVGWRRLPGRAKFRTGHCIRSGAEHTESEPLATDSPPALLAESTLIPKILTSYDGGDIRYS